MTAPNAIERLVQVGPQRGSTPGGLFADPATGARWYVKIPASAEHARNEVLAARLYTLAGIEVPGLTLATYRGQIAVASPYIGGRTPSSAADLSGAGKGFVVDAWLANWDVAGGSYSNLLLRDDVLVRIDIGGALRYRAQGAPKGAAFGRDVAELETLRDPRKNPWAAAVFGSLTPAQIEASAARVMNLPGVAIRQLVAEFGPHGMAEQRALADLLLMRRADIAARLPHAQALQDAAGHLRRASAALRAASSLDPQTAGRMESALLRTEALAAEVMRCA